MNNTAIQTFVNKTRSVCFRIPYPIYETCCEQAEKLDLTLTDFFILKIKSVNTVSNIGNTNVKQPIINNTSEKQTENTYSVIKSDINANELIDKYEKFINQ